MATEAGARLAARPYLVDVCMVSVALVWGINASVVKASLAGWDALAFNALRFAAAAVLIFFYVRFTDKNWRLSGGELWRVALLGLVGNGLYQWLFIEAIARSTASNTALMIGMSPLLVTLWGALAGTDRITRWLLGGTAVSIAGVCLVIWGQHGKFQFGAATITGDLIGLGATVCWAAYTVYARPVISRVGSSLRVTAWAMLFGALTNLLIGVPALLRQDWTTVTASSVMGMMYSCVMALGFSYIVYAWAVQRIGGARTALYVNLVPLFAATVAWLYLNERWTAPQWAGAILVIVGVSVARLEDRKLA